ncbi:MAG: class I SAM-dependent methyltransferase [Bacteroidetes bacterium SW_9_63_38]|nr:MAG: class I SAM-dependent methyltransferase [Bacteroidetes bacterium SW_9_63_38]
MSWYEGWFDSDAYDLVYDHRDEAEAAQLVDLIEHEIDPAPDARILDIGCGHGRHARIFARRGYDVTGIDLSEEAITEARAQAEDAGLDLTFERGDMRNPYCTACMDGVVNLFTTFGYFESDAENQRALAAMTQALRPSGWFLQDFLNAPQVADTLVPATTRTIEGVTIEETRWIDDDRINKEITLSRNGTSTTYTESVRLYTLDDLNTLYDNVGLDLVATFGDYSGVLHTSNSPRLLLHARKKPDAS